MKIFFGVLAAVGIIAYMKKQEIETFITGINDNYDSFFLKYGALYNVSPKLLKAISANESMIGKYQQLEPIGGTTGVMHIKLDTARQHEPKMTQAELNMPENEIRVATKHLRYLLDRYSKYPDQVQYAVKAYNGGAGRMDTIIKFGATVNHTGYYKNMSTYWERFKKHKNQLGYVA
jgi:soluble lytic murein transglycosylase-like protein